jgi:hypothetical protein
VRWTTFCCIRFTRFAIKTSRHSYVSLAELPCRPRSFLSPRLVRVSDQYLPVARGQVLKGRDRGPVVPAGEKLFALECSSRPVLAGHVRSGYAHKRDLAVWYSSQVTILYSQLLADSSHYLQAIGTGIRIGRKIHKDTICEVIGAIP